MKYNALENAAVAAGHALSQGHLRIPRDHQHDALVGLAESMHVFGRAKAIMACGSGKTLVQMWIAQYLGATRILVLVPTLALIKQVRDEWLEQHDENRWSGALRTLCVCSDSTVSATPDGRRNVPQDDHVLFSATEFPSCTDSATVNEFLDACPLDSVSVIFATYASAPVVGEAMAGRHEEDRCFDLGIFDEAHKTVGHESKDYGYALHDHNISIEKRLFFTATPRVIGRRGSRESFADYGVASMDDEAIYGPTAYQLSFRDAAAAGIIAPYKVIISVVDDEQFTSLDIEKSGQAMLANQHVLACAMKAHGLKKAVTFHATVDAAETFARTFSRVGFADEISVHHVSGRQSARDRDLTMQTFADAAMGIVTNARCLTEGVDVPAVDVVAFMDRRQSRVDIVQAIGRALRLSPGKTHGHILLPLHVNVQHGETVEDALERTDFKSIIDVLRALFENDEEMNELYRSAVSAFRAAGSATKHAEDDGLFGRLGSLANSRIELDFGALPLGRAIDPERLFDALTTRILTTVFHLPWDERYREYKAFVEKNGSHTLYSSSDLYEQALACWRSLQRKTYRETDVSDPRVIALNAIRGWTWDPHDEKWLQCYEVYVAFVRAEGRLPSATDQRAPTEKRRAESVSASWAKFQRKKFGLGTLGEERTRLLNQIPGWTWSPLDERLDFHVAGWLKFVATKKRRPVTQPAHLRKVPGSEAALEHSLAYWGIKQRKHFVKLGPQHPRMLKLAAIPGLKIWDSAPMSFATLFDEKLEAYISFLITKGRLPKVSLRPTLPDLQLETALNVWHGKTFRNLAADHPRALKLAAALERVSWPGAR